MDTNNVTQERLNIWERYIKITLDETNPEKYFQDIHFLIVDIWKEELSKIWFDLQDIDINFHEEWRLYYTNNSTHADINTKYNLDNIPKAYILSIFAHEIGHGIQQQVWMFISFSKKSLEYHADFIAWYTLKKLADVWVIKQKDITNIWDNFYIIWVIWNKDSHWDGATRKNNLYRGYNASLEEIRISLRPKAIQWLYLFKKGLNKIAK